MFTEERQSLGEIDRSRDRLGTLRHCDIHFINEQNSQELQISHSLRICLFTEGTVGAGFLLLHSHTQSAHSLPLASEFLVARRFLPTASGDFLAARRFLPPDCPSWVLCACSCIHTHNQRTLYHWHPNSWWPDASCRRAAHRGCRALAPAFTHTISAIFTVGIRIPGGQTLPAAGLTIVGAGRLLLHSHTESVFSHTESAQSAQSLLLASLCARASVNLPPAQKDRSLTSATLRFR